MNKALIQTHVIRFKRYSRKAYAAFCSMHKHITIGKLATSICDKQLAKSKLANTSTADCLSFYTPIYSDETIVENESFDVLPLPIVAYLPTTYSIADGQEKNFSYPHSIHAVVVPFGCFNSFFVFSRVELTKSLCI